MTLVYPDTSVVISANVSEISSDVSEAWFVSLQVGDVVSSDWCITEIASALAAKTRAGRLTSDNRPTLQAMIEAMLSGSANFIPIERSHFQLAADFLSRSTLPLGSGDALHLAIAASAGAMLVTLDRRMAEAGLSLGLDVHLLT